MFVPGGASLARAYKNAPNIGTVPGFMSGGGGLQICAVPVGRASLRRPAKKQGTVPRLCPAALRLHGPTKPHQTSAPYRVLRPAAQAYKNAPNVGTVLRFPVRSLQLVTFTHACSQLSLIMKT